MQSIIISKKNGKTMNRVVTGALLTASVLLVGCAGMTDTQQRSLTGGAMGAAGGAAIGALAGSAGLGAAIGGAVGAGGGYLYGQHVEGEQRAYQSGYAAGQKAR